MDKFIDRLSSMPLVSHLMARRRLFFGVSIVFLILIALSLTEIDDPNSWSRPVGSFSHMSVSNGTVLHNGTIAMPPPGIVKLGQGYKRPGYELPLAGGIPLRIMAIGASTTRGDESLDNNGFRRPIREALVKIGNPVNYVGSQRVGNMTDNDLEAYPGARTGQIHPHAEQIVPKTKPNLYLVNVGMNDCFQDFDIPNFYKRYYSLIHYLLEASPRSTVVMGTLTPTIEVKRWNASERVTIVNTQLRRVFKILKMEGKPVVLAEMAGPGGVQTGNLANDGMHPNSAGYEMMARIMLESIREADAKGFLRPAEPIYGIIQDGDLDRQDEQFGMWVQAKQAQEMAEKKKEEQALAEMTLELEKWTAEVELMNAEKAHEQDQQQDHQVEDKPKLRRHKNLEKLQLENLE